MGGTQTPHFYDFWIFDVSNSSKTNHFYLWRPQDTSKSLRKNTKSNLEIIIQIHFIFLKSNTLTMFEMTGAKQKPTILLIKSCKAWIWDQYLSKIMKP